MIIREARLHDISRLSDLMIQLGYPSSIERMEVRFNRIFDHADYQTLVAEMDGKIVGMIGFSTGLFYEQDGIYVRIVAFVVDSDHRRMGIGRKLMEAAEKWAIEKGASGIGLNTGNREERKAAHQFYQAMGFENKSLGFTKALL